jgi:hypothetical protein
MTTQPLAEHAVSDPATAPAITPGGQQRANRLLLWSFIMMFIGVAIGVIGKKLIHDEIVTVVGVLISLAGMFLAVYPFLSPPLLRKHDSSSSQPEVLTQSQSTTSLPPAGRIEQIPSITERTTNLLKTSPRKK